MISKQMVAWGESGSSIREIAAYGERRAAEIGPENVYNFAIGNPSIDPPDCVQEAVERLLRTVPPTQLHAYAPAPGMASVREKVAAYLDSLAEQGLYGVCLTFPDFASDVPDFIANVMPLMKSRPAKAA